MWCFGLILAWWVERFRGSSVARRAYTVAKALVHEMEDKSSQIYADGEGEVLKLGWGSAEVGAFNHFDKLRSYNRLRAAAALREGNCPQILADFRRSLEWG